MFFVRNHHIVINRFFFSIPSNVLDIIEEAGEQLDTYFSFTDSTIKETANQSPEEVVYEGLSGLKQFISKCKQVLESNYSESDPDNDQFDQNLSILEEFLQELD